ncbi:hypothetical protein J6590_028690 [Homalodisca vitripennis]|nr:hypothetical protein J6590_028690 [Homalodisca vitripennis]
MEAAGHQSGMWLMLLWTKSLVSTNRGKEIIESVRDFGRITEHNRIKQHEV